MKVLMISRVFLKGHPKAGEQTSFPSKIENALLNLKEYRHLHKKLHTIRAGNRFKEGDKVSLRCWYDKPYRSKQTEFAIVTIKKVYDIEIKHEIVPHGDNFFRHTEYEMKAYINGKRLDDNQLKTLAKNDGLSIEDFKSWFGEDMEFKGQIICWVDPKY